MKKRILSVLLFTGILFSASVSSQSLLWAKQPVFIGNKGYGGCEGYSVAADNQGNVYETGAFATTNLYYGADTLDGLNNNFDLYLVKYDTNGTVQWATQGGLQNVFCSSWGNFVTTDVHGNVYVTGNFYDTVSFGPYMLVAAGSSDEAFLVKYGPNGNVIWAKQSHGSANFFNNERGWGLATDTSGNIYATGQFYYSATFGGIQLNDPANGANINTLQGNVFLVKYDPGGNVLWARQGVIPSANSSAKAAAVATDAFNNVYVTGAFLDTITFGAQTLITQSQVGEIFLAKYDQNGNALWAKQSRNSSAVFSSKDAVMANAIATDRSGGVYIAGNFEDTIFFDTLKLINTVPSIYSSTYGEMLLVKYDSSGNAKWAKEASMNSPATSAGWSVTVDTLDHIYFHGGCWAVVADTPIYFNVGFGSLNFKETTDRSTDFSLIIELDTAGNVLCGSGIPAGGDDNQGIAVDPSGQYVYLGGDYFNLGGSYSTGKPLVIGPDTLVTPLFKSTEVAFTLRWQPCSALRPFSDSITTTNVTCHGGNDGSARVIPSGGTGVYSYRWSNGQTTQSISGLVAGIFYVTITYSSNSTVTDSVTITAPLSLDVNISPGIIMCAGQSDTLIAGGATTYRWSPVAGLSDSTGSMVIATPSATTIYHVTGSTGTCSDTSATIVTVNPVPAPPVLSVADSLICAPGSALIQTSGVYSIYLWNNGDTTANINVSQSGNYWVTVSDVNGCMAVSGGQGITLYPLLQAPGFSVADSAVCLPDSVLINTTGAYSSYLWSNGDTTDYTYARSTGQYWLTVTDANGCSVVSGKQGIIVHPLLQPPVLSADPSTVCSPDSVVVNTTGAYFAYRWSDGDTTGYKYVHGTGQYSVTVTDANGCSAVSAKQPVTIFPAATPPLLSTNEPVICASDSARINTSGEYRSYLWNTEDTTASIYVNQAGGYWVTVTDTNGCTAVSQHQDISVYPVPSVSITVQGDTLSSFNSSRYQWILNDTIIPGANSSVYVAHRSGNYAVQVTDSNGCVTRSNSTPVILAGISPLSLNEGQTVRIYPDPFTSTIYIKLGNADFDLQYVEIYDVLGQMEWSRELKKTDGGLYSLEAGFLPDGIYCIKVTVNGLNYVTKIVKQN